MKSVLWMGVWAAASVAAAEMVSPKWSDVKVGGHLGQRLNECLERNVKTTDGIYLTDVFKSKAEKNTWQTEFWGKWMHSAVPLWIYSGDAALKANIDASVKNILSTQRTDGYIGNYTDEAQLGGPWDIWGRKYTILGLLHYYDGTGDKAALQGACRVADHLMTQVGPGLHDIYKVGAYHGMASCSVLEPIVWLYKRTHEQKYLDFAKYILSQMEDPADSAKLITKAMDGVDVGSRFPFPKVWWTWENGMKAYEMMSCYQGLLEYYQITGDKRCLDAVVATVRNIIATEINVAGSGAACECWYHGGVRQTHPAYSMMETCVTTTWMRLCESLLRETGDSLYADQLERTLYNAYMSALAADGSTFSKYCPLDGMRGRGEDQCRMHTNCCIANGPRGFVALLESIVMADAANVCVNLYVPSTVTLSRGANGQKVTVSQTTEYPRDSVVTLTISPEAEAAFALKLRIPAWCKGASVAVNGQAAASAEPGKFLTLNRTWKAGDTVRLEFPMEGRAQELNHYLCLSRGPVLLARDTRFNDGIVSETVGAIDMSKPVALTPVAEAMPGRWLCFTANLTTGVNREIPEGNTPHAVHFCDFGSAGNTWKADSTARVWLETALDATLEPFVK